METARQALSEIPAGPFHQVRFSVPAYLCAMVVASETVALVLAGSLMLSGQFAPTILLVAVLVAPLAGLFALPVFLPAGLIALGLINRWKLHHTGVYGVLGAVLAGLTAAPFAALDPNIWTESPKYSFAILAVLGVSSGGFAAGVTYRWVNLQEKRNVLL